MDDLNEQFDHLCTLIAQKKTELAQIKTELSELKSKKDDVKKALMKLKVSYDLKSIPMENVRDDLKSNILKKVTNLQIYNEDGLKTHSFCVKYMYDSTEYLFHFSRRPDEYYHQYGLFINNELAKTRNLVKEFIVFDYTKINDRTYFSNYIKSLTNQEELYMGLIISCYYFLFDFFQHENTEEYNAVKDLDNIKKMKTIIRQYLEEPDCDWYGSN